MLFGMAGVADPVHGEDKPLGASTSDAMQTLKCVIAMLALIAAVASATCCLADLGTWTYAVDWHDEQGEWLRKALWFGVSAVALGGVASSRSEARVAIAIGGGILVAMGAMFALVSWTFSIFACG